jgi:hypothetical protein
MKLQSSILFVLLFSFCQLLLAQQNTIHSHEEEAVENNDLASKDDTKWVGKSGHTWRLRSDGARRLTYFKRQGTIGLGVEFKYVGNSNIPVAARLEGRPWQYRQRIS